MEIKMVKVCFKIFIILRYISDTQDQPKDMFIYDNINDFDQKSYDQVDQKYKNLMQQKA